MTIVEVVMLTSTTNYHTMENNGLKVVTKTFENALFCCKNDLDNHEINNDGLISTITTS